MPLTDPYLATLETINDLISKEQNRRRQAKLAESKEQEAFSSKLSKLLTIHTGFGIAPKNGSLDIKHRLAKKMASRLTQSKKNQSKKKHHLSRKMRAQLAKNLIKARAVLAEIRNGKAKTRTTNKKEKHSTSAFSSKEASQ